MFSNIAPSHYFDDTIFQKEKDLVFRHNWLFAGFQESLKNHNDFITLKVLGTPVVIQNFKGELKAFLNVCSHRFSIIQTAKSGNRPMMCPYHGWTYDDDGIPVGIPKKPMFKDFSQEELCDLRLKEFKVAVCGQLVFFSFDPTVSLQAYLGSYYQELESISRSMGPQVDANQMEINCNWKIAVENTLEGYHVLLIHRETIQKLLPKDKDNQFDGYHSSVDIELKVMRTDPQNAKIDKLFETREYKIDGYRHIIIFPNLLISTTHGTSYNFSHIEPVSASQMTFTSYVYTAKVAENASKAFVKAFEGMLVGFNRDVFAEDKDICEVVQKGVPHTQQPGILSLMETRVHHFQETYTKLLAE